MEDKELTFWEHLDVLRWAIVRIVCLWFVLAIGYFIAMPYIFDTVILGPCHDNFVFYGFLRKMGEIFNLSGDFFTQSFNIKLQNINLAAPFFVHLSTAFVMSIVTTAPYLFWEIWLFIRPALYPNESRGVKKALLLGTVMFYLGVAVGYFMVYPMTLRFLSTYNLSPDIETLISLNSYIDNFMVLVLCMGLAFELPLVTWLLSLLGILTRSMLKEYRRHAFVVIVIVAAIITPTGDPFTLMAVTLPLYALYELSILMIKDKKEEDDDDDDDGGNDNGGGKSGDDGTKEKAVKPNTPSPSDSGTEKVENKKSDKETLEETFRKQKEADQIAKNIASNNALQERLNAKAAEEAKKDVATNVVEPKALESNTETPVKEALATAAATTAATTAATAKVQKEPRMVIVNDEIFYEYSYEDMPEEAPVTDEKKEEDAQQQSSETQSDSSESEKTSTEEIISEKNEIDDSASDEQSKIVDTQTSFNFDDDPEGAPNLDWYYENQKKAIAEEEAAKEMVDGAKEEAVSATVDEAATETSATATASVKPTIDVSGIKYDFGRFNQK